LAAKAAIITVGHSSDKIEASIMPIGRCLDNIEARIIFIGHCSGKIEALIMLIGACSGNIQRSISCKERSFGKIEHPTIPIVVFADNNQGLNNLKRINCSAVGTYIINFKKS
jgi:hypothetical protein